MKGEKKMAKKKLTWDERDRQILESRRRFMRNTSLILASAGVASATRLNLVDELARKMFPAAYAAENQIKRMIFIGVRAGFPVIGIGSDGTFRSHNAVQTPNFPYFGNQVAPTEVAGVAGDSRLHLTPASSPHLARHAENLAITQGVQTQGGHVSLFNFWQGGAGQSQTSPIIDLAERNTSGSMIPGVHFLSNNPGRNRRVTHQLNGKADLLTVHEQNFTDNFKRPSLLLTHQETEKVLAAAATLSRRQARRIQGIVDNPMVTAQRHHRGAEMLQVDYSTALGINDMGNMLNGSGPHQRFGRSLAYTLKAMSLNLVNSATVELNVGDWHGLRNDSITRPHYESVAEKLGLAADYLKRTPDPANPDKRLWDSTLIAVGSEFTRLDRDFNQDNGDGGSQGILLLGPNVNGGYYGEFNFTGGSGRTRVLSFRGFDPETGRKRNELNTTTELYHTLNALLDNPGVNRSLVWNAFVKKT